MPAPAASALNPVSAKGAVAEPVNGSDDDPLPDPVDAEGDTAALSPRTAVVPPLDVPPALTTAAPLVVEVVLPPTSTAVVVVVVDVPTLPTVVVVVGAAVVVVVACCVVVVVASPHVTESTSCTCCGPLNVHVTST